MIEFFRRFANSLGVRIFLGILALCFVFLWGGHDGLRMIGLQRDMSIATLGGDRIAMHDYQLELQRELIRYKLQSGQDLTEKTALMMGLHQSVLHRMISQRILANEVHALGIGVSEEFMANLVRQNPLFQTPDKVFSKERFDYVIPRLGFRNEADYLQSVRQDLTNLRFANVLMLERPLSDAYTDKIYAWEAQARVIDGIIVRPKSLKLAQQPTEDDLRNYYGQHLRVFYAPELRSFTALIFPESLLSKGLKEIAGEDVAAIYLAQKETTYKNMTEVDAKKQIKETLERERIQERAADLAARVEKEFNEGKSLTAIATKENLEIRSYKARALPEVAEEAAPDLESAIIQSAFQQDEGVLSPIDTDQKGHHFLILVEQIQAPKQMTFAEAKEKVAQEVEMERQIESARKLAESMVKALMDGADLQTLARQHQQDTFHMTVMRRSTKEGGTLTLTNDALAAVFQLKRGQVRLLPHLTKKRDVEILVTKLTNIESGNSKTLASDKRANFQKMIAAQVANDLVETLMRHLQQKQKVEVNQKLLQDYITALTKEKKEG